MNFWDQFGAGFTCLAPMEGVTNLAFRQVVARAGRPEVFFTEFTNVSSYASEQGRPNALARLKFLPEEQPMVAQIWGVNPEHFAVTADGVRELGYQAVDINMGCPDKHVVASGGGAALSKNPELAVEIITATKQAGLSTSVKTRLGYSKVEEWREWLTRLLEQDLAALMVHLRTKKEMSKVAAHAELVPEIVALRNELAPQTKLIINGDIKTPEEGQNFIKFGADGLMIGRGVFADPWCFCVPARRAAVTQKERFELLEYHLDLFDQYEMAPFDPLKRFFKIYVHDFNGAAELRERLMNCRSTEEARSVLRQTDLV